MAYACSMKYFKNATIRACEDLRVNTGCKILEIVITVYWESFTEENIRGFWNDCQCFLAAILYLLITYLD